MAESQSKAPEHSDEEIAAVRDDLLDLCDDTRVLDYNVDSVRAERLDNPWEDRSDRITVFMTDLGSGVTKASIISAIITSDVDVELVNTADGHAQITFKVCN
jgi:hypothetical protein